MEENNHFIAYEYLSVPVRQSLETLSIDCYKSFGWQIEGMSATLKPNASELKLKRDRRLKSRADIIELQYKCEVALQRITKLEALKTLKGTLIAVCTGIIGTAFLAGAVFSYLAGIILLCVILAIPGFIGCLIPYYIYSRINAQQETSIEADINRQYDIIYLTCERANTIMN